MPLFRLQSISSIVKRQCIAHEDSNFGLTMFEKALLTSLRSPLCVASNR